MRVSISFCFIRFIRLILPLSLSVSVATPSAMGDVGSVELQGVSFSGPGCPTGSVQAVLSPDASALTLLYDQFILNVDSSAGSHLTNCEVIVNLHKPSDLGLSIEATDFRGFVSLEEGMTAGQTVAILSGTGNHPRKSTAEFESRLWQGPISEDYVLTAVKSKHMPDVLDCVPRRENTLVIISSELRIESGNTGHGSLTVDSADGRLSQKYHLNWHNCGKAKAPAKDSHK